MSLRRVASYTLAWIEIYNSGREAARVTVASYTLAWIEMLLVFYNQEVDIVASYTLAWIEIFQASNLNCNGVRRKLYACVD